MRFGGLIVALLALLAAAETPVEAQVPPARVYGSVTVNGSPPPAGTVVEAYVNGRLCGSGEVRDLGAPIGIGYIVDVNADAFVPGCAREGAEVSFKVGGLDAAETVMFRIGAFIQQDLTARGQPASPPPATATPAPSPSPTSAPASPTSAPSPSPSSIAESSPTPAGSPAAGSSPAPSPTAPAGTGTPTAGPSSTRVQDSAVRPSAPGSSGDGSGGGGPLRIFLLALGAGLLAAGGAGVYVYLRNRSAPPA